MDIKKLFNLRFYLFNKKAYKKAIAKDIEFNSSFRNGGKPLRKKQLKDREFQAVILYRKWQVNIGNIWGKYYDRKLKKFADKTGIDFANNPTIGEGLIIGHWGRIIINGGAKFGNQLMITHGVNVGRDVRGARKGTPTFGNRVCIRANSTVVGNITIGDDVLIAPNTFVNFDVPSHSIVIGNPATIHHRDNATEGHLGEITNE